MVEKEYIERDAVIAALGKLAKEHEYADGDDRYPFVYGALTGVRQSEIYVKSIPAADVAPVVHAEWVDIFSLDNNEHVIATCNYCKERGKVRTARNEWGVWYINSPRCPNCGAKMDGGADHG